MGQREADAGGRCVSVHLGFRARGLSRVVSGELSVYGVVVGRLTLLAPRASASSFDVIRFSIASLGRITSEELLKLAMDVSSVRSTLLCLSGAKVVAVRNNFVILCGGLRVREITSGGVECGGRSCRGLGRFCGREVRRVRVIKRCTGLVMGRCGGTLRFMGSCFGLRFTGFVGGCFSDSERTRVDGDVDDGGRGRVFKGLAPARGTVVSSGQSRFVIIPTNPKDNGACILMQGLTSLVLLRRVGSRGLLVLAFSESTTSRFGGELVRLVNGTTGCIRVGAFRSCYFSLVNRQKSLRGSRGIMEATMRSVGRKGMRGDLVAGSVLIVSRTRSVDTSRFTLIRRLVEGGRSVEMITINSSSRGVCRFEKSSSECVGVLVSECGTSMCGVLRGFEDDEGVVTTTGSCSGKVGGELGRARVIPAGGDLNGIYFVRRDSSGCRRTIIGRVVSSIRSNEGYMLAFEGSSTLVVDTLLGGVNGGSGLVRSGSNFRLDGLTRLRCLIEEIQRLYGASVGVSPSG